MAEIPDLWGESINVDALTPTAILRAQAAFLSEKTKGIVRGSVDVTQSNEGVILVGFYIKSRASGLNYTEKIAQLVYEKIRVYLCYIGSHVFEFDMLAAMNQPKYNKLSKQVLAIVDSYSTNYRIAMSQHELFDSLSKLLSSQEVQATVESLIATANEGSLDSDAVETSGTPT